MMRSLEKVSPQYPSARPDDLRQETAELLPPMDDQAAPPAQMDFVERCFVAMTVLGLVGLTAAVMWMWVT